VHLGMQCHLRGDELIGLKREHIEVHEAGGGLPAHVSVNVDMCTKNNRGGMAQAGKDKTAKVIYAPAAVDAIDKYTRALNLSVPLTSNHPESAEFLFLRVNDKTVNDKTIFGAGKACSHSLKRSAFQRF
jgi:hypothetical protein